MVKFKCKGQLDSGCCFGRRIGDDGDRSSPRHCRRAERLCAPPPCNAGMILILPALLLVPEELVATADGQALGQE
jgi:hypothetical protein